MEARPNNILLGKPWNQHKPKVVTTLWQTRHLPKLKFQNQCFIGVFFFQYFISFFSTTHGLLTGHCLKASIPALHNTSCHKPRCARDAWEAVWYLQSQPLCPPAYINPNNGRVGFLHWWQIGFLPLTWYYQCTMNLQFHAIFLLKWVRIFRKATVDVLYRSSQDSGLQV